MKTEPIDEIQTIENIEAATDNIESNSFKLEPAKWRRRLLGFFIDAFPIAVLSSAIAAELGDPDLKQVFFIMIYIPYCLICEGIFNRTMGKLITDTIVVDSKRFGKPSFGQILGRTFSRLIPFDGLSFISTLPNGWHDSISNTMVTTTESIEKYRQENPEIKSNRNKNRNKRSYNKFVSSLTNKLNFLKIMNYKIVLIFWTVLSIAFIGYFHLTHKYTQRIAIYDYWGEEVVGYRDVNVRNTNLEISIIISLIGFVVIGGWGFVNNKNRSQNQNLIANKSKTYKKQQFTTNDMTEQQFRQDYYCELEVLANNNAVVIITKAIKRSNSQMIDIVKTEYGNYIKENDNWTQEAHSPLSMNQWDYQKLLDITKRFHVDYFAKRALVDDFYPLNSKTTPNIDVYFQ